MVLSECSGLGGYTKCTHCMVRSSMTNPKPIGCHRTTKANIRFHLYGGPQGWNPHSFGPECWPRRVINPSKHIEWREPHPSTRQVLTAGRCERPAITVFFLRITSEGP